MPRYLAELHKKSDPHKRRFALLASATFTLFIFGVWFLVTFGTNDQLIATNDNILTETETDMGEASPFQSFRSSLALSFEVLKNNFEELKQGVQKIDFGDEYQEMKNGVLKTYGQ